VLTLQVCSVSRSLLLLHRSISWSLLTLPYIPVSSQTIKYKYVVKLVGGGWAWEDAIADRQVFL
jgi:hypothetical protein